MKNVYNAYPGTAIDGTKLNAPLNKGDGWLKYFFESYNSFVTEFRQHYKELIGADLVDLMIIRRDLDLSINVEAITDQLFSILENIDKKVNIFLGNTDTNGWFLDEDGQGINSVCLSLAKYNEMISAKNDDDASFEELARSMYFTFVHELGHAVHAGLNNALSTRPFHKYESSFLELFAYIFSYTVVANQGEISFSRLYPITYGSNLPVDLATGIITSENDSTFEDFSSLPDQNRDHKIALAQIKTWYENKKAEYSEPGKGKISEQYFMAWVADNGAENNMNAKIFSEMLEEIIVEAIVRAVQ